MMIERILLLSSALGISPSKAYVDSGAGKNFASNIKAGQVPSVAKIQLLANYFNVTTDYLLGNTNIKEKSPNDITFDDFTYAMHNESRELTDEDKEMLLNLARRMKKKIDEKKGK